jgi:hypothetical protein
MTASDPRLCWHETAEIDGATVREFTIHAPDRPITGVLWWSETSRPGSPMVCYGHGASGDRHQRPIPRIAGQLARDHGFFGLSIDGPVHGLMGLISDPPHYRPIIEQAARSITCPVFFLWQLEDELFTREECLALFDAFALEDKRLHANPGLHPNVPFEELDFGTEFLSSFLSGTRPPREVMFAISE